MLFSFRKLFLRPKLVVKTFNSIYIYITPSNQHFKAFPMSKFNSETSFLYQLFKGNSNFIVLKPWKAFYLYVFQGFHCYLYLFFCLFMYLYTFISTFQFRDKFSVSTFQREFKFHSEKAMQGYLFVCLWCLCFLYLFIHTYIYTFKSTF